MDRKSRRGMGEAITVGGGKNSSGREGIEVAGVWVWCATVGGWWRAWPEDIYSPLASSRERGGG